MSLLHYIGLAYGSMFLFAIVMFYCMERQWWPFRSWCQIVRS